MTDPKKPDADIVATPENEPEFITDDKLDSAEGGWSFSISSKSIPGGDQFLRGGDRLVSFRDVNAETIYGVSEDDILDKSFGSFSKTKLPDPYGF